MSWRRLVAPVAAAFLFYLAVTLVMTDPLPRRIHGVLAWDVVDPALNTWILSWNSRTVPLTRSYWDAPIFHPLPGMLTLSESLVSLGLLTTPLRWMGASPEGAYNVAFLLSFPLSALAAHLLTLRLTGRQDASFVSGLLFGFSPYRSAQVAHLQVLCAYGIPVVLLGLHAFVETRRFRWLLVASGAWVLQGLANGYYLFYVPVLAILWILYFVGPRDLPALGRILLAFVLAAACALPALAEYRAVHERLGLRRTRAEIESYGADVAGLVSGTPLLAFPPSLVAFNEGEQELFPGRVVLALWLLALVLAVGEARRDPLPRSRATRWLLLTATGFGLAALSVVVVGPWHLELGFLRVSASMADKPLGLACLCLMAAALTSRVARSAQRRQSPLWFYASVTALLWVLACGPSPRLLGTPFWYRAPYDWLLLLPGWSSLRAPGRFAMLSTATLAVAGGLVTARLLPRRGLARALALVLLSAGILADGWLREMRVAELPRRSGLLEAGTAPGLPVLELPLGNPDADAAALYRQCFHGHSLWNGYSGHSPPHYPALRTALALRDKAALQVMAEAGSFLVRVERHGDRDASLARFVMAQEGARLAAEAEGERLFEVPAQGPRPLRPGPSLPIAAIRSNTNQTAIPHLLDGDLESRWHTGPQQGYEELTVDLGWPRPLGSVVLRLGSYVYDFPVELIVEWSRDGEAWTEAFRGGGAAEAVRAALQSPRDIPMRFALGGEAARFVRLRQTGRDPVWYWSVAELGVEGPG